MYEYKAELIRWIDGDTLLVEVDLGFHCKREERVRLARIDAWELNSDSAYRRRWAKSIRFKGRQICPEGEILKINTSKNPRQDMYARYIAEVFYKGKNLSDELLKLGRGISVVK